VAVNEDTLIVMVMVDDNLRNQQIEANNNLAGSGADNRTVTPKAVLAIINFLPACSQLMVLISRNLLNRLSMHHPSIRRYQCQTSSLDNFSRFRRHHHQCHFRRQVGFP
jgi:GH15 family glucan-1,4-alpha-glucosidase